MLGRLFALSLTGLTLASVIATGSASAQTFGNSSTLPGTTVISPDANSGTTTLPGVTDPTTTNSTTGTLDQEDHCQPPGTPTNTNPTAANGLTMPRPEPACN